MIKILHTSDIHLGAQFKWLKEKASIQRQQLKESFKKIVDLAIERSVNVVVLAGDIFDNSFPSELSSLFFRDQLYRLSDSNIKVYILPGNHDRLEDGSIFTRNDLYQSDPNIFVLNSKGVNVFDIPELNLSILGNPVFNQKSTQSALNGVEDKLKDCKSKYRVVIAHGSYELGFENTNYPIKREEVDKLSVQYIALGDWHSYLDLSNSKTKVIYSGSPELVEWNQKGSGFVSIVEMEDESVKVEKVKLGLREFKEISVELGAVKSIGELKNLVEKEANPNLVLSLVLKGTNTFNLTLEELKEDLESKFFFLVINDDTFKEIDWGKYNHLEENTIISEYLKLLKDKIQKEPDKEEYKHALSYGVSLLQKEKDENTTN